MSWEEFQKKNNETNNVSESQSKNEELLIVEPPVKQSIEQSLNQPPLTPPAQTTTQNPIATPEPKTLNDKLETKSAFTAFTNKLKEQEVKPNPPPNYDEVKTRFKKPRVDPEISYVGLTLNEKTLFGFNYVFNNNLIQKKLIEGDELISLLCESRDALLMGNVESLDQTLLEAYGSSPISLKMIEKSEIKIDINDFTEDNEELYLLKSETTVKQLIDYLGRLYKEYIIENIDELKYNDQYVDENNEVKELPENEKKHLSKLFNLEEKLTNLKATSASEVINIGDYEKETTLNKEYGVKFFSELYKEKTFDDERNVRIKTPNELLTDKIANTYWLLAYQYIKNEIISKEMERLNEN